MTRRCWQLKKTVDYARFLPDFLIIGAQRCGTTSLYSYLISHPNVTPAKQKEVHFFDTNFAQGLEWYASHFDDRNDETITGEASPYYVFHPLAPWRIAHLIPDVKLFLLLRNPVARAYSHYWHEARIGAESLPFEEAVQKESERLAGEAERIVSGDNYYSFNHHHYSYLSRGIYVDQIQLWMELFRREQILIIKSDDFFMNPPSVLKEIFTFLKIPDVEIGSYPKHNFTNYPPMAPETRTHLAAYFKVHNQRLSEYLNMDFLWKQAA